ncbi:hypothetical protein CS022_00490 [Veronia nyctiphanis]|uniref:HTH araC/xylS-type domain-containing protein n=1 Tax=Veronia nyctiphanis TaxID=1278244 RepID=A0A4Q0YU05_9GAMM|nr:helix-turn-helix transcriptional regulator [Veronia nyctiphanis]RXJ74747.1 hypothetical protein CS022_00490 [Veronia nyctiphanis]
MSPNDTQTSPAEDLGLAEPNKDVVEDKIWVAMVRKVIEQQFHDPSFSPSMLASELSMSQRTLQRKFKLQFGMSVREFISVVRLEKASEMLMACDTITDVAFACGFNEPSYFAQRFKQRFGVSPSQFIEDNRVGSD